MTVWQNVIGLVAALGLWGFGRWREKRHRIGDVPLIPAIYIQFFALVVFLALAANLVALATGVDWKNPQHHF
ncbi:MAG: hypothetical protein EP335_02075 [Alphaproteobacteria bacterium]|nr:MAG: hypothetical protein EP335_02075 [Alphaproteobacteria bacterium]